MAMVVSRKNKNITLLCCSIICTVVHAYTGINNSTFNLDRKQSIIEEVV